MYSIAIEFFYISLPIRPGRIVQSVARLTQELEAPSFHTRPGYFKKGSCQLLAKYVHLVLVTHLGGLRQRRNSMIRLTECKDTTTAAYRGRKETKTTTTWETEKIRAIPRFIIYLKRSQFTLHWSKRAICFSYCTESSAYCTELRSHVRQNYFCFGKRKVWQPFCCRQQLKKNE